MKLAILFLSILFFFACESGIEMINKAKKPVLVLGKRESSCGKGFTCYTLICKDGNGQLFETNSKNLYSIYNVGDTIK